MLAENPPTREVAARPHWWHRLHAWQRAALAIVLLGTLLIGAALIYFRPGDAAPATSGAPALPAATTQPNFPPGTRWADIPDSWNCPDCGMSKSQFEMVEL